MNKDLHRIFFTQNVLFSCEIEFDILLECGILESERTILKMINAKEVVNEFLAVFQELKTHQKQDSGTDTMYTAALLILAEKIRQGLIVKK
jgi:hypothetical protein